MLVDMDCDADGTINMDEWIKGGMNNIPFLVLLGLDVVSNFNFACLSFFVNRWFDRFSE